MYLTSWGSHIGCMRLNYMLAYPLGIMYFIGSHEATNIYKIYIIQRRGRGLKINSTS
jgi:hypothetical protein